MKQLKSDDADAMRVWGRGMRSEEIVEGDEGIFVQHAIGVQHQQPFARSELRAPIDARRKTFVVFVDQKRHIGKTANDGNRFIARGVVYDDDFGGLPCHFRNRKQARRRLCKQSATNGAALWVTMMADKKGRMPIRAFCLSPADKTVAPFQGL